eukprot:TRINITY_DN2219_c0_g1_i1.p1 TRINITY_DN2219_c0_g1~~TRINITY_DN2219_c0_g1_i1.p1  ORF type:complete len:1165 (-),score=212.92 TRINITY_DN2219_c0_g1_i1:1108-4602(-)
MTVTAKDLFAQGEYRAAEKAFLTAAAKNAHDPVERSLQLSNAAQCVLNISEYERAAQHAREAVGLDACNKKAHYRLASAYAAMPLPQQTIDAARRCCDIAMANARAFALIQAAGGSNSVPNVVGLELVSSHRNAISARAADLLRHVSDSRVVLVSSAQDIRSCAGVVAVLVPNCRLSVNNFSLPAHIVGLDGSAVIKAFDAPHAFFLERGDVAAWGLRFKDASGAMICSTSDLTLVDCSISEHMEHGVLVAEATGNALIAFCTLNKCVRGIEVREGASATVVRSEIRNMSKAGISAYGGARSIVLEETKIENVGIEGVQCVGPRAPGMIDPLGLGTRYRQRREQTEQENVGEMATASARENVNSAQLMVTMRNCCVRRCGTGGSPIVSGVTMDQGARATIQGCLFAGCRMAGVFIKGGCDVCIQHSRFDHGNGGDAGVRVDINYEGNVNVQHCVFVGKPARAIVDMLRSAAPRSRAIMRAMTGARSAPVNKSMIKTVARARNAPSIESLREDMKQAGIGSEAPAERTHSDATGSCTVKPPGGAGTLYRVLGKQNILTQYPIGNTFGTDVLQHAKSKGLQKGEARVVLAACGDIRNVVETICGLKHKQLNKLSFVLNDISMPILARNVALLELACRLWPNTDAVAHARKRAARIWLHAWGSIALTAGDHTVLQRVLADLSDGKLPNWLEPPGAEVRSALTSCWSEWASCKRSLREVRSERDALTSLVMRDNKARNISARYAAVAAGLNETQSSALLRNAELLNGGGEKVNATLLDSGLHYNMYESCIFRAIDMRAYVGGDVSRLHAAACDAMNEKGRVVARALLDGCVRIDVQPGDLTLVLARQREVDAVELSNAMDYISKAACLISAARCVSRPGGVLMLHTMMARALEQCAQDMPDSLSEYLLHGARREDVAQVLGVRAVEVDSGSTESPGDGIRAEARWVYQATSCEQFSGETRDKLVASMMKAAKRWCSGRNATRQDCVALHQIAAWPSAVAALHVVTAALRGSQFEATEVVRQMCRASAAVAAFKLQLNAHAAMMDGKMSELVVATVSLRGVRNQAVMGLHKQQLFQLGFNLGKANEETMWLFDVFEWCVSRGVCEVVVREEDVLRMKPLSARVCAVCGSDGAMEGESEPVSLIPRGVLTARALSDSEMEALRQTVVQLL